MSKNTKALFVLIYMSAHLKEVFSISRLTSKKKKMCSSDIHRKQIIKNNALNI